MANKGLVRHCRALNMFPCHPGGDEESASWVGGEPKINLKKKLLKRVVTGKCRVS